MEERDGEDSFQKFIENNKTKNTVAKWSTAGKEGESRGGKIESTFTFHVNNISFDEKIILVPQSTWDAIVGYPNYKKARIYF